MEFTRDFLVKSSKTDKLQLSESKLIESNLNKFARKSLERKNEANRYSEDEAKSIHIITEKLNCRLKITYETEICGFYGKPDFIIKLGKFLYIMVSTTRAINIKNKFDQIDADRLIKKKLLGLTLCSKNLECLIDDDIDISKTVVRPVLHILSPCDGHSQLCIKACEKLNIAPEIKILISNLFI